MNDHASAPATTNPDVAPKISHKDFESIVAEIIDGKRMVPNYEEMSLEEGVAHIAAGGGLKTIPGVKNAKVSGSDSNWGHWARYFLGATQGGQFDGTGYVMFWVHSKGRIGRFAICKHKQVEGHGANHSRGWHPSRCSECGLDTSVDSGD